MQLEGLEAKTIFIIVSRVSCEIHTLLGPNSFISIH
jgi:hypothetical protein